METGILKIFQHKGKLFLRIYCWWLDEEISIKDDMIIYPISEKIYKRYCENNYPGCERFIPLSQKELSTLILDRTFRRRLKEYVKLSKYIIEEYRKTILKTNSKKKKDYIKIVKKYKKYEERALRRLNRMINKLPLEIKLLIEVE